MWGSDTKWLAFPEAALPSLTYGSLILFFLVRHNDGGSPRLLQKSGPATPAGSGDAEQLGRAVYINKPNVGSIKGLQTTVPAPERERKAGRIMASALLGHVGTKPITLIHLKTSLAHIR